VREAVAGVVGEIARASQPVAVVEGVRAALALRQARGVDRAPVAVLEDAARAPGEVVLAGGAVPLAPAQAAAVAPSEVPGALRNDNGGGLPPAAYDPPSSRRPGRALNTMPCPCA
jgi:hypothetical protein